MNKKLLNLVTAVIFTFSLISTGLSPVKAQSETTEWKLVGQIGGSTQAVAVLGRTAYAGTGLKMNILSFADPEKPALLGSTEPFSDFVTDIAVFGSRAFVADGQGGVSAVDVSDTSSPSILGTWTSAGFAEAVAIKGSLAAVADGALGFRLVDFSDPTTPKEIGAAFPLNYAFDVALAGNYAYIAAGDSGLLVADISDPTHPQEAGTLDTDGYAYGVAIHGSTVYIADGWAGIETVDISTPEKPALIGNTPANGWSISVAVGNDFLYSGNAGMGVQAFDISTPQTPKPTATYNDGGSSRQVAASGSQFFAADTMKGVRMLDASNPDELIQMGIFSDLPYARRATLDGDYLYVAAGTDGAMYVINVADPTHPYQVSKFQADGNASDVAINVKTAILTTFMDSTNYMVAIDISNPADLKLTSTVPLGSVTPIDAAPREAVTRDNTIFVVDEFGLRIFDISDPANIHQYGQIQTDSSGNTSVGIVLHGNYAYLAASSGGVRIVDISDLQNPKEVGNFDQSVGSLAVNNDLLYIGEYGSGVKIASINSDGKTLSQSGTMTSIGQVEDVAFSEGTLFANEGKAGIQVIDASTPSKMVQTQLLSTPGYAWSSEVSGNVMYESDGNGGILIFAKGDVSIPAAASDTLKTSTTASLPPNLNVPHWPEAAQQVHSDKVCTVTSTDFSGAGTLFECISNTPAGGTITFDPQVFLPKNPATIVYQGEMPQLTNGSVTIDGSNAGVILDGNHQAAWGLVLGSSYNVIMGLQFTNFNGGGIQIGFPSSYNTIGGDHTLGDGPTGQGNAFYGNFDGIQIGYCHDNVVKGNFVGTLAGGTQAGPYTEQGIVIGNYSTNNYIGGKTEGEKNIISGNNRGVDLMFNTSMFNTIAGNYIGTDITGTKAIPNYDFGVILEVGTRFNTVGGTSIEERNIISGNSEFGLTISDDDTTENTAIGNYIGVDVSGTKALPNKVGMTVYTAQYNRVGGNLPGEGNLISGNQGNGLAIYGMGSINAIVLGNTLGLDANGKSLPNGNGIYTYGGSHSFIGGLNEGSGNIIDGGGFGLGFEFSATSYNWAAGNTIASQNGILINNGASHIFILKNDLMNSSTGISLNSGDFNTLRGNLGSLSLGENGHQNLSAPVLDEAAASTISGTTIPMGIVDFYAKDSQSMTYLGSSASDENGNFTFTINLSAGSIVATVTDLYGNTSGYSNPIPIK